jgi:alkaline phosphatase
MDIIRLFKIPAAFFLALFAGSLHASAIYPIDRASILAGSKFDIKVELNSVVNLGDLTIELNGTPLNSALGKR